jgi:hypothetical protein
MKLVDRCFGVSRGQQGAGSISTGAVATSPSCPARAVAALIADELAYWFDGDTSANSAEEILGAVKPGMLQFGGRAMLVAGSSPYRRTGPLWDAYRRHYGKASRVLFWRAPTLVMNPLADRGEIERAYDEDAQKAAAEFGAEFRQDLAAFIDRAAVEAVVAEGRRELLRANGITYQAFCDPSGGSSDSMTLAVAHRSNSSVGVLDCVREIRAPFSPEAAVSDFAAVLQSYGIRRVTGDHYAGEWPIEVFAKRGIQYIVSERTKSHIYLEALPLLNAARVELLDNERLISQIASLERRTARGGRESIDHPQGPGARDDLANSVLGVLVAVAGGPAPWVITDELIEAARTQLIPRPGWEGIPGFGGRLPGRRSGVFF